MKFFLIKYQKAYELIAPRWIGLIKEILSNEINIININIILFLETPCKLSVFLSLFGIKFQILGPNSTLIAMVCSTH